MLRFLPELLRHVPTPLIEGLPLPFFGSQRGVPKIGLTVISIDSLISSSGIARVDRGGFMCAEGSVVGLAHRIKIIIAEIEQISLI